MTHRGGVKGTLGVICIVWLAACGDTSGDADAMLSRSDARVEPRIEVGGGLLEFEPFGDESEMIMGLQGGWHIDVSTRFYDIDAVDLQLTIVGVDPDTNEQVTRTVDRLLQERHTEATAPGIRTRTGDRLILDITEPAELAGRTLVIRVSGLSTSGVVARGEASVVVVDREL